MGQTSSSFWHNDAGENQTGTSAVETVVYATFLTIGNTAQHVATHRFVVCYFPFMNPVIGG